MEFPGRPRRIQGYDYGAAGPIFHCRIGVAGRAPVFGEPRAATLVVDALKHYQAETVHVFAYCVMPDHVHVLVALREANRPLPRWIGDLKRWVVRETAGESLRVSWQRGFFERVLRSDEDVATAAKYIVANPVRAGLATRVGEYPWAGSFEWGALESWWG